ncbi:hypothetical protein VDG1235_4369 [Verrucomicrobiia bacterium DG1235]|nr:hypothetical protein VDG1235_4369 [Verrucomicrobiae bacterium DG1235]
MRKTRKKAFTLLEVVIALAMLALIAVPAFGIAVLTLKNSAVSSKYSDIPDLIGRIESAISKEAKSSSVPSWYSGGGDAVIYSSRDLKTIEISSTVPTWAFYEVRVSEPTDYTYDSTGPTRILLGRIRWPIDIAVGSYEHEIWTSMIYSK